MKISIITVSYNSVKTIKDTIESVLNQSYTNFEYLIIDGLSIDDTTSIVENYNDPRIRLISEKDNGLYDAMNKGIKIATGDIIGIINSDDVLDNNDVFKRVTDNFTDDVDILHANVKYYDEKLEKVIRNYVPGDNYKDYWCGAHPSMYIRKEVYKKIGLYNLNYNIAADYDFMVRCNTHHIKYKYLNTYFVKMRYGGKSNGLKGYFNNFMECVKILKNNKVSFPLIKTIIRTFITFKSYK